MPWLAQFETEYVNRLTRTILQDGYTNSLGSAMSLAKLLVDKQMTTSRKSFWLVRDLCSHPSKAWNFLDRYWPTFAAKARRKEYDSGRRGKQ